MTRLILALRDVTVVARGESGAWDDPHAWSIREVLSGSRPKCVALDPSRPHRILCGTADHGLWISDDGGESWHPGGAGIREERITAIALAPDRAGDGQAPIYLGTEPSAVYRSDDGGDRWDPLPDLANLPSASSWSFPPRPETHHVRWLESDPAEPDRVYACIEAGALLRSDDGGRSWRDRVAGGPLDTHTLATHRGASGRLYAAAGDGYFESHDAGETWRQPEAGLRDRYLFGVAVDPEDPETVLVSAAPGPRQAYDRPSARATVYRRTAGGVWSEVTDGLPDRVGTTVSVLIAPAPGVFWAANNRGIHRSADGGRTWRRVAIPWPERYVERDLVALAAVGAG